MVLIVLSGGIGAQMFQFAAGFALAKKNNCKLIIDTCWFNKNNVFATKPFTIKKFLNLKNYYFIKNIWISRLLRFFFLICHYFSFGKYNYLKVNLHNPMEFKKITQFKNLFLNGYVQNIDYFKNDISEILDKIIISEYNKENQNHLYKIAMHVRKGDQKNGPVDFLNNDYYQKGLKKILDKKNIDYDNLKIVIFCEEIEWPKKNLIFDSRVKNIEYIIGDDNSAVLDLQKMMNCDSIIMSNSGYSWWTAAYINQKKKGFVVCPDLWWNRIPVSKTNIYLDEWMIVQTNIQPNQNPEFTA
jgi:hypothetical protein